MELTKQDANNLSSTFEEKLYERATMPDSQLRFYGYTEHEIALLREYAKGGDLSDTEMQAISGTCSGSFYIVYANKREVNFYYEWCWDHCPIVALDDAAAISWTAYGYDGRPLDLIVQEKNTQIQYYINNEGTRDVYDYSVRGELEPELSFDGLCLRVPVLGDRDPGSGLIISYYAKMGIVGVELKVDDSVTRDIYCVEASGLYAHTQAGIGFPSINLINGKLSFGGNLSINQIAEKKVEIYNDGTMKYV